MSKFLRYVRFFIVGYYCCCLSSTKTVTIIFRRNSLRAIFS